MTQRVQNSVTWSQTFDAENRLVSVSDGTTTTQYIYDGSGNRVKKIVGNTTTIYVAGMEIEQVSGSETQRTIYYPAGGAFRVIVVSPASNTLYYRHSDHLGSTSVLSDSSGAKVANSDVVYAPFGVIRTGTESNLTDFGYTGQRHDDSTGGLMYYGARYYLPGLARFISADTIVPGMFNPQALNRYSYVLNSPLNLIDPTGHVWQSSSHLENEMIEAKQMGATIDPVIQKKIQGGTIAPTSGKPPVTGSDSGGGNGSGIDNNNPVYDQPEHPRNAVRHGNTGVTIQTIKDTYRDYLLWRSNCYYSCGSRPSLAQFARGFGFVINMDGSRILAGPPGYPKPNYFKDDAIFRSNYIQSGGSANPIGVIQTMAAIASLQPGMEDAKDVARDFYSNKGASGDASNIFANGFSVFINGSTSNLGTPGGDIYEPTSVTIQTNNPSNANAAAGSAALLGMAGEASNRANLVEQYKHQPYPVQPIQFAIPSIGWWNGGN